MVPKSITDDRCTLRALIQKDAYSREKVILSSGKESDYYIDARRVTLNPLGAYLSARLILDEVKEDKFSAIGGPTLGADPLVGAIGVLGLEAKRAFTTFIIRKSPKPHGKKQQIEGPDIQSGDRVILIDDVATTGQAFLESIAVLKKLEITPVKAVCLVDRREGAEQALAKVGVAFVALFDIGEFHKEIKDQR